jgi:hypothetical protein
MDVHVHHIGMLAIGCSVGHGGYWMSYWHWGVLDTLFIVVIEHFEKHKENKPVKNKTLRQNSWFKFSHWSFAFICNNTPALICIWNTITKLIRYSGAYGSYQGFRDRRLLLTKWLLNHLFLVIMCMSSIWTFYGRHHDFVKRCVISVSHMSSDMSCPHFF